jgi:hypothetical protein
MYVWNIYTWEPIKVLRLHGAIKIPNEYIDIDYDESGIVAETEL